LLFADKVGLYWLNEAEEASAGLAADANWRHLDLGSGRMVGSQHIMPQT
jgi:hypothetical protein